MPKVYSGDYDFDSFADQDFADGFLAGDVSRAALWAARNDDAKGRGLSSATRQLRSLSWIAGDPPEFDAAPGVVKEVTAMLAADLLAKPKLFADASGDSNLKSAKAGSASVEFFKPVAGGPPLPRALWQMLVAAGLVGTTASSAPDGGDGIYAGGVAGDCRPRDGRFADYRRDGWLGMDRD